MVKYIFSAILLLFFLALSAQNDRLGANLFGITVTLVAGDTFEIEGNYNDPSGYTTGNDLAAGDLFWTAGLNPGDTCRMMEIYDIVTSFAGYVVFRVDANGQGVPSTQDSKLMRPTQDNGLVYIPQRGNEALLECISQYLSFQLDAGTGSVENSIYTTSDTIPDGVVATVAGIVNIKDVDGIGLRVEDAVGYNETYIEAVNSSVGVTSVSTGEQAQFRSGGANILADEASGDLILSAAGDIQFGGSARRNWGAIGTDGTGVIQESDATHIKAVPFSGISSATVQSQIEDVYTTNIPKGYFVLDANGVSNAVTELSNNTNISARITSSATSNAIIIIPDPTSTHEGKIITVYNDDASTNYTNILATLGGVLMINPSGTGTATYTLGNRDRLTLSCQETATNTYRWIITTHNVSGDTSDTDEGLLSVGAGGSNDADIVSNTTGSTPIKLKGAGSTTVTENTGTGVITISSTGGGEIDTAVIATRHLVDSLAELSAASDALLALTIGTHIAADADTSTTNEIQNLSASSAGPSGAVLALSSDATAVTMIPGTGIGISVPNGQQINLLNTAPDQLVAITDSGVATVSGTYPNFNVDVPVPTAATTSATPHGTVTGTDVQAQLEGIAENTNAVDLLLSAAITLSGRPAGSTDLGTFPGTTIQDGSDNKEALQALETAVEAIGGVTEGNWEYFTFPDTIRGVTSGAYVYAIDTTTITLAVGTYRLDVSGWWNYAMTTTDIAIGIEIDGDIQNNTLGNDFTFLVEPQDGGIDQQIPFGGSWVFEKTTASTSTIKVGVLNTNSSSRAIIGDITAIISPLSPVLVTVEGGATPAPSGGSTIRKTALSGATPAPSGGSTIRKTALSGATAYYDYTRILTKDSLFILEQAATTDVFTLKPATKGLVPTPTGFSFNPATIGLEISYNGEGVTTNIEDITRFRELFLPTPRGTGICYVTLDGDNGNNGLSEATAKAEMEACFQLSPDTIFVRGTDTAYIYDRNKSMYSIYDPLASVAIIGYGTRRPVTGCIQEADIAFQAYPGHGNTYFLVLAREAWCIDLRQPVDLLTGVWPPMKDVASVGLVQDTPGSYYDRVDTLFVHMVGGVAPVINENILIVRSGSTEMINPHTNTDIVYVENLTLLGTTRKVSTNTRTNASFRARDCDFAYGRKNANLIEFYGGDYHIFSNVRASYTGTDIFNWHSQSSDICNIVEHNTTGNYNGYDTGNNQISTLHDGCVGIRINARYGNCQDEVISDVNVGTQSWNLGVKLLGDSFNPTNVNNSGFYQVNGTYWFDRCLYGGQSNPVRASTGSTCNVTLNHFSPSEINVTGGTVKYY